MYSQAQHHPGKPKRKEQSRTRLAKAKMISVATPMFAEKGYGATSISEIEIKANVKRGMLVYHFKTKRNLWMEFLPRLPSDGKRSLKGVSHNINLLKKKWKY
jgi:hypothetical protein